MSTKNNGGPAFPGMVCVGHSAGDEKPIYEHPHGMTLRDYFAAKAMAALISKHGGYEDDLSAPDAIRSFSERAPNVDQVAKYAYSQADFMLKARDA